MEGVNDTCEINNLEVDMEKNDVIKSFIDGYEREFDFFDQAARLVHGILETELSSSGIASIVTYRAKNPDRLEKKLHHRNKEKDYKNHEEIYDDIADFSGVRVALYFPGTREEVKRIIEAKFIIVGAVKEFPQKNVDLDVYKKRFSGYGATHFRVHMKSNMLESQHKRYVSALVEIQIASVLMHAWSEVEHDLIYKPEQGALSVDEYAILDELNGLVLAGEIALERLQSALRQRLSTDKAIFSNRFELATWLLNFASDRPLNADDGALGQVDALYYFIKNLKIDSPIKLKPFVAGLVAGESNLTFVDQIVERICSGSEEKYMLFRKINLNLKSRIRYLSSSSKEEENLNLTSEFLRYWTELETLLNNGEVPMKLGDGKTLRFKLSGNMKLPDEMFGEFRYLRNARNSIMHGIDISDDTLSEMIDDMKIIIDSAKRHKAPVGVKSIK
jgi:ppGpp synthetase/RelA/SpoT-type nucleotidyltranferase